MAKIHTTAEIKKDGNKYLYQVTGRLNANLVQARTAEDPAWRDHCARVYYGLLEIVHRNGRNGSLLETEEVLEDKS